MPAATKQESRLRQVMNKMPGRWLASLLLCSLAAVPGYALESDRDQPIHITADQALRDESRGHTVYSGNVLMIQGSMELEADRLTIFHRQEEADKFVAKGKPARMRQAKLSSARASTVDARRNDLPTKARPAK